MNLNGSETKKNLLDAFSSEAQSYARYMFFSDKAFSDGFVQISNIFKETASDEKTHAFIWYRFLNGGTINDTYHNLENAFLSEKYLNEIMYRKFEKVARSEGFIEIADKFREVAEIEKNHEFRFQKLHNNIKDDIIFTRDIVTKWQCIHCGHIHFDVSAPNLCPVCNHKQGFFQIDSDNF